KKFQELRQRAFDFGDDPVNGNVREAGGKIGKQAFKGQELLCRRLGSCPRHCLLAARTFYLLDPPQLYFLSAGTLSSEAARRAACRRTARPMASWHGYVFRGAAMTVMREVGISLQMTTKRLPSTGPCA